MASIIVHAPPAVIGDEITGRVRRIRGQRSHYTCAYCEKVFKRSEHRIRHERTHTNEKPFSCRYCRRSYSRKDLVTRHERTLHAQGQTEPCALPAVSIGVDGDGSSDGSLSDVGDALSARRSRDDAAATSILDADRPLSESGASPASSANRVGAAALVSLSNHVPSADDEDCMGTSSVMEQTLDQPSLHEPSMAQAMVSGGRARRLTSLSDAPSTVHLGGHQPDIYTQDRFDLYDASPQMPMDVDHDQGQRHEGYQNITQQPHSKTQQHRPEQPPEFHAFSQFDSEALSGGIVMNQGSDVGQLPTTFEHVDMSSYFAFSPFPAGLFEAGQNMPNISSIPDIFEYPGLSNPIPSRMDPAITPVSALPPHSPSEHLPGTDAARSSESDALGARQTPSNLPRLVKDKPPRIPSFVADDALHASICKDLAERLGSPDVSQEVPSSKLLQGFLASFMECYYRHQPFIHLPTLSTVDSPSPLTLAMCCIGALYRLDRRRAQRLYAIGTQSIETDIQRFIKSSEDTLPLWVAQTKLLFTAYAALSGDKDLTQKVMNENGFYTLVYNKVRLSLAAENADINKMTWDSWVRRESWKRLLGGIYVASTVHVIIWDTNPGFNTSQDLDLEVLHDESLWNAKTATEWSELRTNQPHQEYRTLRDGLASIMSDSSADSPRIAACRLSPFTALLLMHAVVVHVWQVVQVAQSLAPTSPPGHDPASSLLMSAAVRSLARSHELLVIAARSEEAEGEPGHHHDEGTSQIFNCQATLRMAYIRLFSVASGGVAARPSLMTTSSDPAAAKAFASSLAVTRLERSPQLLDAVVKAFEGLRIPVRMGHMLVRKTAALRWSPAHAIAGWDCALFVCKWVHSVEMDRLNDIEPSQAECEFLATIREVLEEAEYDPENSKSLAAGVARTWSFLLQDVWVWSITPRMGAVLEQMAAAFERVNDANRRQGE